jgi:hypothetical protein
LAAAMIVSSSTDLGTTTALGYVAQTYRTGTTQKSKHLLEEKSCKTSQTYVEICVAITYSLHSNPKLLIVQNVALSLTLIFFIFSTLVKVNEGIYVKNLQV